MASDETPKGIEQILDSPDLAVALESDRFKQFLDQVPVAIAVSKLAAVERVVYTNVEFERLVGRPSAEMVGGDWSSLPGEAAHAQEPRPLARAIDEERDYIGSFVISDSEEARTVDAWSNMIEDDDGTPVFRLVALVETATRDISTLDELQEQVNEKDVQLRELQHRVRNNLQMITALIRVEARGVTDHSTGEGFDRLAGRVEALGLLYRSLESTAGDSVDLGIYLSEIASAVMRAHAVEGIRLDMKVDTWPASIDVAMPAGLVVNELMTNALKHAFDGRDGGTITLRSTTDPSGCQVIVADDGVGLPEGVSWPRPGKLSALIVSSLLQNAKASLNVKSAPGDGVQVIITFTCEDASPDAG
jgi:two-component sensor histidine kinase